MKNEFKNEKEWFPKAHFGMFIHFGLYTLLGKPENSVRGDGEQQKYADLMKEFNPYKFNADEWVKIAREGGAQYIVFTSKHAEGFCLWDSKSAKYKITDTPFKRDLLAELADSCARHKMKLGLYYNGETWLEDRDVETYPAFINEQLKELMTQYGPIATLWLDHSIAGDKLKETLDSVRKLQPNIIINDRGDGNILRTSNEIHGDYVTPERNIPYPLGEEHPFVECCDAMGVHSWGYHKNQSFWSSPELIRRISKTAAIGANYLLNVEPQPNGEIRPECVDRMSGIGKWLKRNKEAIFNTTESKLQAYDEKDSMNPLGYATQKGNSLYLHLHQWPLSDKILLPNCKGNIKSCSLLNSEAKLENEWRDYEELEEKRIVSEGFIIKNLPPDAPENSVSIIKLDFADNTLKIDKNGIKKRDRKSVEAPSGETLSLLPETACLSGEAGIPWHKVNHHNNGRTSIGSFIRWGCEVSWEINAKCASEYTVFADLGTSTVQKDATFQVEVTDQALEGVTVENGWYDTPERLELGKLKLKQGKNTLRLKILKLPHCFSDIHAIILQP